VRDAKSGFEPLNENGENGDVHTVLNPVRVVRSLGQVDTDLKMPD
jgi:hypothetical protein